MYEWLLEYLIGVFNFIFAEKYYYNVCMKEKLFFFVCDLSMNKRGYTINNIIKTV